MRHLLARVFFNVLTATVAILLGERVNKKSPRRHSGAFQVVNTADTIEYPYKDDVCRQQGPHASAAVPMLPAHERDSARQATEAQPAEGELIAFGCLLRCW